MQSAGWCGEGEQDAQGAGPGLVEGVVSASTVAAVETLIGVLDLDEAGEANAAIARALASKLDEARDSESGAAAVAISGIAKELRAVIDDLRDSASDRQSFVSELFSEVGDTAGS